MKHEYDLFEKFSDGSSLWRDCIPGFEIILRLQELAWKSDNQYYAIDLTTEEVLAFDSEGAIPMESAHFQKLNLEARAMLRSYGMYGCRVMDERVINPLSRGGKFDADLCTFEQLRVFRALASCLVWKQDGDPSTKDIQEAAVLALKEPVKDEITHRAYALYLMRGCEQGRDAEDWAMAEKELSDEFVGGGPAPTAASHLAELQFAWPQ